MDLVYYQTECPNFGDDLNKDIWPALAPQLFEDGDHDTAFVGIGTVIGMNRLSQRRIVVFSSGAGNDPPSAWADREVHYQCVRGPVTARLLNLPASAAITDGALLTPLTPGFPQAATRGGGICVIPHFQTIVTGGWEESCALAGMRLVDPRGSTQEVVRQIAGADMVLTESLHGAILADTYGVPWRAFMTSGNFGVAKWIDWTASVQLPLDLTVLPPPNALPLLRYGRCRAPLGHIASYGVDDAMRLLQLRLSSQRKRAWDHRRIVREIMAAVPALQKPLGLKAERTAAALADMAGHPGFVSQPTLRQALTERMLDALSAVTASPSRRAYA